MASKSKPRDIGIGEVTTYPKALAKALKGKTLPAAVASTIHQWSEFYRSRGEQAKVIATVDYMRVNWFPEASLQQIETALETLIKAGMLHKYVPEDRKAHGHRKANHYWLTEYGLSFFPAYNENVMAVPIEKEKKKEEKKEEPVDIAKLYEQFKQRYHDEMKATCMAELKVAERKAKAKKKKEEPIDEEIRNFANKFKEAWNEQLPKKIHTMTDARIRKLSQLIEQEKRSGKTESDIKVELILLPEFIAQNDWLVNEYGYGKGFNVDSLLKEDKGFENYNKLLEGGFGGISFTEWLEQ